MTIEKSVSEKLTRDLWQILAGVYGPNDLRTLIPHLVGLAESGVACQDKKQGLDEKDIILITYGDSIRSKTSCPLQTLNQFLKTYIQDSVSAVHILPCYPYTSDDGFSVTDYWAINSDLGDWEDIRKLSAEYELMFDAVINHISKSSSWFQGYLNGEKTYRDYFIEAKPNRDYSSVTRPRALPLLTPFITYAGEKYIWTTFSEDQIDLNFRCPEVFSKIVELLLYYIQQGARYIRLDAIGFMWKELDTPCLHLPQTHALIQAMRVVTETVAPYVKLITETNVPHQDNISYFGNGDNEAHLVYQFPLPPLTLHTIQTGNSEKIVDWLSELAPCSDGTTFFNFLASHDGIGVRPVEGILSQEEVSHLLDVVQANGGRVSYKDNGDGTQSPYELNINYFDAVSDMQADESTNLNRYLAAQSLLISMAGVPGIYIHSLLGSGNDLTGLQKLGYNRAINREKLWFSDLEADLSDEKSRRSQVLNRFKGLLGIRKQQAAFSPSASQRVMKTDNRLITFVRGEQIAVVINISSQPVELNTSVLLEGITRDLITGDDVNTIITILPYQVMWLK